MQFLVRWDPEVERALNAQ